MIVFTICSRDSFAYASALHESFGRHHPGSDFYVALSERDGALDTASIPFTVLRLAELGLPDLEGMVARYDETEFRAAIKPFAFQVLFDRHPGSGVLYLGPEVFVTGRFSELLELVSEGAQCVLTPALTEPAEHAEFEDSQLLRYGVYDLGFCYLVDSPPVRRVVWWWARRLKTMCLVDPEAGLFLDQRWADLFPAFIEGTFILRHPGYSVSYWNLSQRRLQRSGGGWSVNGMPLRCFNFSGANVTDDSVDPRHTTLFQARDSGPTADLLTEFRSAVRRHSLDHGGGRD